MTITKFLDLDAVSSEIDFGLKLNDKDHKLQEPTVEIFITNMRELESLSINATPREEMEMSVNMILRSFPTIKREELMNMRLSQLREIGEFTRRASGQDVATEKPEGEAANPPAAS